MLQQGKNIKLSRKDGRISPQYPITGWRNNMIIRTFEDALMAVELKIPDSEIEFPDCDLAIKPTNHLWKPVPSSRAEGRILDRQAHIHFE
jgi:hypothetical protein